MATFTHHSSHSSIHVALSIWHERLIILQDHVYLLRLLDAIELDDNHDEFEESLDLEDSF